MKKPADSVSINITIMLLLLEAAAWEILYFDHPDLSVKAQPSYKD